MIKIKKSLFVLLGIILFSFPVLAEEAAEPAAKKKDSTLAPIPLIFYTPETSGLFGGSILYFWNRDDAPAEQKSDVFSLFGVYTLRNQIILGTTTENYFANEDWLLKSAALVSKFPDRIFGVGPSSSLNDEERFTPEQVRFMGSALRKVFRYIYIGPRAEYIYYKILKQERISRFRLKNIPGREGGNSVGLGLEARWDSRDLEFYPTKGFYVQVRYTGQTKYFGSDYNFWSFILDFRHYTAIYGRHILAWQFYLAAGGGNMPFYSMPMMGGPMIMRGYWFGRFRDRNMAVLQAEYRFPIYDRLSGVLFGAAAQVSHTLGAMDIGHARAAGGAGLRFLIDRERQINYRLDFALYDTRLKINKKDTWGVYLAVMEAI